jgi:hypothetical protein
MINDQQYITESVLTLYQKYFQKKLKEKLKENPQENPQREEDNVKLSLFHLAIMALPKDSVAPAPFTNTF